MSEQLTPNPFASLMARKNSDELLHIIKEKDRYEFEAAIAVFEELDRRQLLTPELLQEKETFIADYNEKLSTQTTDEENHGPKHVLDLLKIRQDYFVTPIILYTNVLVFVIMAFSGVHVFEPTVDDLINWGGNIRALTLDGEPWRLLTSIFLHGGIFHLLLNMFALAELGYILERNIGKARFAIGYLIAGMLASITSVAWNEKIVSVGASGAIFGMDGILLALLLAKQLNIPEHQRKAFLSSTMIFISYNLFYGFTKEGIDNAAHIGGLLSGIVIGFAFGRVSASKGNAVMFALMASVVIIAMVAAPKFISNKFGEYERAMNQFVVTEKQAMWMYDQATWSRESKNPASLNDRLQTEGVDLWNQNLSLLNSLADMPEELQTRIDLLKKYCELRRQLCEALKMTLDQPEGDVQKAKDLSEQINTTISELEALNKQ